MNKKLFEEIFNFVENLPVIDCHEHTKGWSFAPEYKEPITSFIQGYVQSDLISAGIDERELKLLLDQEVPTEKKWVLFKEFWEKIKHTGYGKITKIIVEKIYGEKEITLSSLKRISEKLLNLRDEKVYMKILEKSKIKCRLVNILYNHSSVDLSLKDFIDDKFKLLECDRILIPLIMFHLPIRNRFEIEKIGEIIDMEVDTLDKFLDACRKIFLIMKEKGAVGMKDQSAYERVINFEKTTKYEAEKIFNFLIKDPRNTLGWPEVKPLDDYLFHEFLNMAEELDLPVQIHTGHMAGIRNDVSKANAIHLRSVFEIHKNVKFDIFHANWPYSGELLFLAKNYPNVNINLCWVYIIDPYYTYHFLIESLVTIPFSKIHGFGGDYTDIPEFSFAHLEIAKEIIARTLTKLIEMKWINLDDAKKIAIDLLFNNPNRNFKLGFTPL